MKYISRLTALLLAMMMIVSDAGALTVNDLTQGTMDAMYTAVSGEQEEMAVTGVLGESETLTSTNATTWAGEGYALQWYAVNAEGERTALTGETNDALTVTYLLAEQRFVCVATDSNGNVYAETPVYVVAAQTDDMEEYLLFLYDYAGFYTDSGDVDAVAVYNFMHQNWNIAVEDSMLAANVVAAWWTEKDDSWFNNALLCSCVVTEAAEADFCMLHPYEAHEDTCGWYQDATVLQDETTGITVTGDIPAGVSLQVTAATGPMPEIDTSHVDITATSPMLRSHNITLVNEDGTKYIVPEGTTVRVNIPEVWSAWMTNPIVDVYHVTDDGEVVYLTSRKGEVILMDDHSICFETDGFSEYTVVVGARKIDAMGDGAQKDIPVAPGSVIKIGEYWNESFTFLISNENVVSASFVNNFVALEVSEEATVGTVVTVTLNMTVPWETKVRTATVRITVADEVWPETIDETVSVGTKTTSTYFPNFSIARYQMAPDTTAVVNCGSNNFYVESSNESIVHTVAQGNKVYINVLSAANNGDTAKVFIRDTNSHILNSIVLIDIIDEPDPATLSYTATHTVDRGDMDTGAFSDGAVLKYCIAPGMTASATGYGDVEFTVEDESIATVSLTDDVFKVTANANAEIDEKTKIVVKDKTTKAVVTTIFVEIVPEYVPPTAKDKLSHVDYPVQLAIRNDGELPNEPWIYTSSPYTYFERSVNEDGKISHWIGSNIAEIGETAAGIIATTIVDHEKFKLIYPDGADVIGLVDPSGEILLSFLSGINWDSLMDCVVARNEDDDGGNNITVADGTVVTSQNRAGYRIIPYVVKCQEGSGQGWHIDCAVVAKDAVLLSYDVNVPDGMIILTENVALPNNETGAAGSVFNVGKIVDSKTNAALTELTVEPDYKFTFLGWNTKEDGTGTMYQPDSSITITEDTTLYAIWSITPELGTGNLKVRKLVNDAAATGNEAFTFSISVSNADEDEKEYDYVLYGADSIAVKDADGNVVSGKIKSGDTFALTDGQYVVITGLPIAGKAEGAEAYTPNVTVTETTPGEYAPTWSGGTASGASVAVAIMDGRLSEVTCTNAKAAATGELKVTKDGLQNSNESAIVDVVITTGGEPTTYILVLNKANPTAIITNIPIGSTYTVTERTSWTWLYSAEPTYTNDTGTIGDTASVCTITNHSYSERWMHDESYLVNNLGTGASTGVNK